MSDKSFPFTYTHPDPDAPMGDGYKYVVGQYHQPLLAQLSEQGVVFQPDGPCAKIVRSPDPLSDSDSDLLVCIGGGHDIVDDEMPETVLVQLVIIEIHDDATQTRSTFEGTIRDFVAHIKTII